MVKPRTTCPDCEGKLTPINIRDYAHGAVVSPPQYEPPGPKVPWWRSTPPAAGVIHALMCGGCGRVLLYAEPKEEKP